MEREKVLLSIKPSLNKNAMTTVTVSAKFRVVIPKDVRSKLKLRAGHKLVVIEKDGIVNLIPLKPVKAARGLAKGANAGQFREEYDRF